jgi:hypothetical protein
VILTGIHVRHRIAVVLSTLLVGLLIGLLALAGCQSAGSDSGVESKDVAGPRIDILYLNHPPVQPVVRDIDEVLASYQEKITVRRLDAESEEGRKFAAAKGLTGHVALAVLFDGTPEVHMNGRTVRFEGFPQGRSPLASAQGNWNMDDLRAAIELQTAAR